MKSNTFGLDIGTTTTKIVWLSKDRSSFRYNSALLTPTPLNSMQSESQFDHQELAKFLNKAVIEAKIGTNNVNIALPENRVFTKVITMPVLTEKELANAIYWEAEQYIPAQLDTMTLDWNVLYKPQTSEPTDKMQVLLVAAPIQLIKRYQSILELAGLSVASIETEILSVLRGVVRDKTFPTSLLIHLGAVNTSLAIVQNGMLIFNYTIPLGGAAMTRGIATDFGFTQQQAEEYKNVYGLSDKNFGGKVKSAINPILTEILSEVKKSIAFYREKYKNQSPISQILLTGGTASLPGIDVYFVQNFGIETVTANPWKLHGITNVPEDVQARGSEFVIALGLALKEYEV